MLLSEAGPFESQLKGFFNCGRAGWFSSCLSSLKSLLNSCWSALAVLNPLSFWETDSRKGRNPSSSSRLDSVSCLLGKPALHVWGSSFLRVWRAEVPSSLGFCLYNAPTGECPYKSQMLCYLGLTVRSSGHWTAIAASLLSVNESTRLAETLKGRKGDKSKLSMPNSLKFEIAVHLI